MVLYLHRMCQYGLHAVPWLHIAHGILMSLHAAEPRSNVGFLSPSQCLCVTILLTTYSMVWDWRVIRAGPLLTIGQDACCLFIFHCFPFSSFFIYSGIVGLVEFALCMPYLVHIPDQRQWMDYRCSLSNSSTASGSSDPGGTLGPRYN